MFALHREANKKNINHNSAVCRIRAGELGIGGFLGGVLCIDASKFFPDPLN